MEDEEMDMEEEVKEVEKVEEEDNIHMMIVIDP